MPQRDYSVTISINSDLQHFQAVVGPYTAVLEYSLREEIIVFTHTEVPNPVRGKGVGSALAKAALDYARDQGFTVLPLCPFVEDYIRSHPEHLDLVESAYRAKRFATVES